MCLQYRQTGRKQFPHYDSEKKANKAHPSLHMSKKITQTPMCADKQNQKLQLVQILQICVLSRVPSDCTIRQEKCTNILQYHLLCETCLSSILTNKLWWRGYGSWNALAPVSAMDCCLSLLYGVSEFLAIFFLLSLIKLVCEYTT